MKIFAQKRSISHHINLHYFHLVSVICCYANLEFKLNKRQIKGTCESFVFSGVGEAETESFTFIAMTCNNLQCLLSNIGKSADMFCHFIEFQIDKYILSE